MVNEKRVRLLQGGTETNGPVIYWMSRDQRAHDNWALLFAQQLALEKKLPLAVVFNLVPKFLEVTIRQYGFMLKGLKELEEELERYNIPFFLLSGKPEEEIPKFIKKNNASLLISDFDPLRIKRIWKRDVSKKIQIPFYEVDAHNIVPCFHVSNKLEFAAYTIRPKINKALIEFMDEFSPIKKTSKRELAVDKIDWEKISKSLKIDFTVDEVDWLKPGEKAAHKYLNNFFKINLNSIMSLEMIQLKMPSQIFHLIYISVKYLHSVLY